MNQTRKISLLILICLLRGIMPIYAITAYPFLIADRQPDGTKITIRLQGDERSHFQTTEDGYLIKRNKKGFFTYATRNAKGHVIEGDVIAKDSNKRSVKDKKYLQTQTFPTLSPSVDALSLPSRILQASQSIESMKAYPKTGSPKALVILIEFSDNTFSGPSPQIAFSNLLNQTGYSQNGATGSACDYFKASTFGQFSPVFDVVGPYKLPNALNYYGQNDIAGNDSLPQQMVIDACTLAAANGINFTQYDTDNNGFVDNIFIYYAGYNEAEGAPANTVWPHRWRLPDTPLTKFNNKIIDSYACTSELKGVVNANMCGIGTFCHEFGHVMGLPDYYHTTSSKNTLKSWSIMDEGGYNNGGKTPPVYSAFDRFFLGYFNPVQVSTPSKLKLLPIYQGLTVPANTNNQSYLIAASPFLGSGSAPNPAEFFMVEYRKKTGWDSYLPAEGMLIWHIDFNQSAWTASTLNNYGGTIQTPTNHMRLYLQPLTGNTATPGTAFSTGSFIPTLWAGTDIRRALTKITKTADSINFKLMEPLIATTGGVTSFSSNIGAPSAVQSINLSANYLTSNININFKIASQFDIKQSTESTWAKSVMLVPNNGILNATIDVRFNPAISGTLTDVLRLSSLGADTVFCNLSGTSVNPNAPLIMVGAIESEIKFPTTKINEISTKIFKIQSTDITGDLSVSMTGTHANMFNVLPITITKADANSPAGAILNIIYSPLIVGVHDAIITITGGGLMSDKVITLIGEGL